MVNPFFNKTLSNKIVVIGKEGRYTSATLSSDISPGTFVMYSTGTTSTDANSITPNSDYFSQAVLGVLVENALIGKTKEDVVPNGSTGTVFIFQKGDVIQVKLQGAFTLAKNSAGLALPTICYLDANGSVSNTAAPSSSPVFGYVVGYDQRKYPTVPATLAVGDWVEVLVG